jgi:hypothetical protein
LLLENAANETVFLGQNPLTRQNPQMRGIDPDIVRVIL